MFFLCLFLFFMFVLFFPSLTRTATYISRSLGATVSVFVLGGLRWLQSVWAVQLLVAAAPLILWLRVLSR